MLAARDIRRRECGEEGLRFQYLVGISKEGKGGGAA